MVKDLSSGGQKLLPVKIGKFFHQITVHCLKNLKILKLQYLNKL